ncbi:MAG: 4-hydroxybenzoate octaprenyltransferase, partial [Proteobacteria bacterium]|nr:4-hydroxybenzoate octaprenyltransferase [Pseudomonadota bacterium]
MIDINKNKIIFKLLPLALHKYILLFRLDRPIGFMLLFYPVSFGLSVSSKINSDFLFIISFFLLGSIIMRSAGCIINDLWDRNIDIQIERTRTRPIASGEISVLQALISLAILLFFGFLILIQFNLESIILGIIILPLVFLYPLAKKNFFLPQLILGLIYNWGVFIGWSSSGFTVPFNIILLLYVSCVIWTVIYDTIYATMDEEDDKKIGIYSSSIFFGSNKIIILNLLIITQFILLIILGNYFSYSYYYFILVSSLGAVMFFDINFIWKNSVLNSLKFFKRSNAYGAIILISLMIGNNLT